MSKLIHGLPCSSGKDNPVAVAEELETVGRVVVTLDHGPHRRSRLFTIVIGKLVKNKIHLFIIVPGDQKLEKLARASGLEDGPG